MHILHVSSELHPFSKTGGLADMVAALAKALVKAGLEVTVLTPLYRVARSRATELRPLNWRFEIRVGARSYTGAFWEQRPPSGERIVFVEQDELFDRDGLYGDKRADYPDNADRFIFFSRAAALFARHARPAPQILHGHDWQTGLVPLLVRHAREREGWRTAQRTVFTIHNLAYGGLFARDRWALTGLPAEYLGPDGAEFWGSMGLMKTGLSFADALTTVSPHYAWEITTPEFGQGLEGLLRRRRADLRGILNGVDYEEWNTTTNRRLAQPYTVEDLTGKAACKAALQREFGLPERPDVPLFGNVGRLDPQKGVDLLIGAMRELLNEDIQFVLLGSGLEWLERGCRELASLFPGKASVNIGFDNSLAHRIEAGIDFFVMPSRFEPCGLNQLYSLRYGCPPIVRDTGGLHDSVFDPRDDAETPTGLKFSQATDRALAHALRKALVVYRDPALLSAFRRNGMTADFSWSRQSTHYVNLYGELAARP